MRKLSLSRLTLIPLVSVLPMVMAAPAPAFADEIVYGCYGSNLADPTSSVYDRNKLPEGFSDLDHVLASAWFKQSDRWKWGNTEKVEIDNSPLSISVQSSLEPTTVTNVPEVITLKSATLTNPMPFAQPSMQLDGYKVVQTNTLSTAVARGLASSRQVSAAINVAPFTTQLSTSQTVSLTNTQTCQQSTAVWYEAPAGGYYVPANTQTRVDITYTRTRSSATYNVDVILTGSFKIRFSEAGRFTPGYHTYTSSVNGAFSRAIQNGWVLPDGFSLEGSKVRYRGEVKLDSISSTDSQVKASSTCLIAQCDWQ